MAKSVTRARTRAFQRQLGRCHYCNVSMWIDNLPEFASKHGLSLGLARPLQCTAEHLHARCDGGSDSQTNIVAACRLCNWRRHARRKAKPTPEAYRCLVQRRVRARRWHADPVFRQGLLR